MKKSHKETPLHSSSKKQVSKQRWDWSSLKTDVIKYDEGPLINSIINLKFDKVKACIW